jgi:hypothetical protein
VPGNSADAQDIRAFLQADVRHLAAEVYFRTGSDNLLFHIMVAAEGAELGARERDSPLDCRLRR